MGDRKQQDVAVLAAAALLLGGIGVSRVVTHDDSRPAVPTQVLGERFTRQETSTTTAPAAPSAPTAPPTTATTATTAAPRRSSTTQGPPLTRVYTVTSLTDCGAGDAGAKSSFHAVSTADPGSFALTGEVDVVNNLGRAIHIDKLAVRVSYSGDSWDVVKFPSAIGVEVQPAETKAINLSFSADELPRATSVETLDYHLVGLPQCTAHLQAAAP